LIREDGYDCPTIRNRSYGPVLRFPDRALFSIQPLKPKPPFRPSSAFVFTHERVPQVSEQQKEEAQQVLDGLLDEGLLPFELSAQVIDAIGAEEYIVRFHDSRLRSLDISCRQGQSFKDAFRAAVLDRVKRLSGPLYAKTASSFKPTN
jgi:hypothetical protein